MTRLPFEKHQRGAITLLVTLGLVTLAALTSFFSARSVLVDQLASRNHAHALQAQLAADAALAGAQALIAGSVNPVHDIFSTRSDCPAGITGLQWQCQELQVPPHPGLPQAQLSATLARDLVDSPHVLSVHARASITGQQNRAHVQESLFVPVVSPAPAVVAPAALVLNGCVSEAPGATLRICPLARQGEACQGLAVAPAIQTHFVPDTDLDGNVSPAEINECLNVQPGALPMGGDKNGPSKATTRHPCSRAAWRSVLGDITNDQLQAWSTAQERQGLTASTSPARTIYWIDSPGDWHQSLGSTSHPVLLVFSALACSHRCPNIGAGVRIVGSVLVDSGCNDDKVRGWQAGSIEGQLVVESGLPEWRSGSVLARPEGRKAYTLHWPEGIDAARTQRIPGSWSEGTR